MHRTLVIAAAALLSLVGACGDDTTDVSSSPTATIDPADSTTSTTFRSVEPGTFEPATEGTMVRWSETAGECQVCGFSITFDAGGTATYEGHRTRSTIPFAVDVLFDLVSRVDHQPLTTGADDCGREVDGNAPVLEVFSADGRVQTVDDCYRPIDREHPLMSFVLALQAEARELGSPLLVEVLDIGGLCADGDTCRAVTRFFGDGAVVRDDGAGGEARVSSISTTDLDSLTHLVREADEEALVLGTSTGACASEVDGQDRTYVIGGDDEEPPIVASDCDDDLVTEAPLLVLVDRLVANAVTG